MAIEVLDKVVAVNLDIHIWSARKKLKKEDLKRVSNDQLPPPEVASLGSKKICDPKEIAKFEALKRRAIRACGAVGVRFLGGYAVPQTKIKDLIVELEAIRDEFEQAKKGFINRYDSIVSMWIASHPDWESAIRRSITPVKEVDSALSFGYQAFKVAPAGGEEDDQTLAEIDGLTRQANGLADRLFAEIATQALKTLEESFKGKASVTRRAIRPIIAIRDKLDGLSFLDPRVYPVMTWIEELLADLPKNGPIEGTPLMTLESALITLSDESRIKELGASRLSGKSEASTETKVSRPKTKVGNPIVDDQLDVFDDVGIAAKEEDEMDDLAPILNDEETVEEGVWFYGLP